MKKSICEKCKNFHQHYTYSKLLGFSKIYCGHCVKHLIAKKECGYFEESNNINEKEITVMNFLSNFDKNINKSLFKLGNLIGEIKNLKDLINKL